MKRTLYLVHRWLGIVLCLFMAMWFVSGVVMMYVGYPKLTPEERLAALPALDGARCCAALSDVLAAAGGKEPVRAVRLTTVAGTPRFILSLGRSQLAAVDAFSGLRIQAVSAADAIQSAQAFMPEAPAHYDTLLEEDAWTHSKGLDAARPLHRVEMGDEAGTILYVSARTGEVVRDATRSERNWNWVGAWIHWLYPFRGGIVDKYWADIVIYASIVATVLAFLGMVVGVWRWRFAGRFRSGSRSPYREPWMRWHHVLGLVFGVITVTFIFSGLMSMNPFRLLDSGALRVESARAPKDARDADLFALSPQQALQRFAASGFEVREMEWRVVRGNGYFLGLDGRGGSRLLAGAPTPHEPRPFVSFKPEFMQALGRDLLPEYRVVESSWLTSYDNYYYWREPHTMTGGAKQLPIMRMKFDDPHGTWLQLDPRTGAVINQLDSHRRVGRWLFAFLHSWDWPALLDQRPWWDVWMIAVSLGGLIICITGIVLGSRRLKRKLRVMAPTPRPLR